MTTFLFSLLFPLSAFTVKPASPTLKEVRALYVKAAKSETACRELITILKPYNESNDALLFGYKASANMMMAKYAFNPFSKLSWFNKGKKMLETAIQTSQSDVELRCLRFAAQSNIPSFLGYNENIQKDKHFILEQYPHVKDETLKKNIVAFLTEWGKLTESEKAVLK